MDTTKNINQSLLRNNQSPKQTTETRSIIGALLSFCSGKLIRGHRGLSFKEAEKRLKDGGKNISTNQTFASWQQLFWRASVHPFHILVVVMAILSYLATDNANGSIMLVLVLISVGLRFHQEFNSSRAAMELSELLRSPVRVQRCAGRINQTELVVQIDRRDIVPGDIIHFSSGDLFPGDVRLITSNELVVSQSSLTGESRMTEKTADFREVTQTPLLELHNICFMGTSVISGNGTGLIISTGSNTYMNTIFSALGKEKPPDAFDKGVRCASYILVCFMIVAVPVIIISNYFTSHLWSESIIFGISVAVALTPQMLPLIVNTSLARGAVAMARGRCIVKNISIIQSMGAMDILCIDKTGTLTLNQHIMVHHLDTWGYSNETVLKYAFLNSYFKTDLKGPLDHAILAYAYTNGYRFQASKWIKIDEIPFDFTRRRVSVIVETDMMSIKNEFGTETTGLLITKGALEEVLNICTSINRFHGEVNIDLNSENRNRVLQMSQELSDDGLQVLGIAIRTTSMMTRRAAINYRAMESDMVFLGIISFFDPPKDSAKQALWRLAEKGVKAKVLTGDSLNVAIKVCKEVGIGTSNVTTGPDLEGLGDTEFHETVKRATVLARLTPMQKLHVVQSLQEAGNHIVGYLGDGINDSLALDAADVGISVDSGASVAKSTSDIILLEKDLNVLVSGVERGRVTYGNTMKYIKMSLVANISSVISLLVATIFLQFEPITPRQLLVQNFLFNLGQIAIPWDNMEEGFTRIPQHWSLKELPVFTLWNGPVCSIFDITTLLFVRFYYRAESVSSDAFFHSAWFVEGLLMQAFIIHMIRTSKVPFVQDMASRPVIFSTIMISAIGIIIPFTLVGTVMGLAQLPLSYYGFLVGIFLGYFSLGQVVKRAYIWINKQWL